jgi:predicted nucleic acid-binding protein
MTFTVVYDANVLYPNTLRDLLIRIAQSGTVQAKWTNAILDEMLAALRRSRPDIPAGKLERLRDLMNKAVRDCLVTGHEPLIEGLKLPDPDDRHVLAAAIKAGAQVIVTRNLKDFPESDLQPWDIEAKSPDAFVLDQVTSTSGRWPRPSGRSRTPGPTRPRQSKTSSPNSNETASSNPWPPSARPNGARSRSRSPTAVARESWACLLPGTGWRRRW